MVAPNLGRVDATMSRDYIAFTSPAFLFIKTATVAPVQAAIRLIQELDAGQPLGVLFAVKARNNQPQRKPVPPWQRLAVHFIRDQGRRLHCLLEPKRLVIPISCAKENSRHVGLWFHLREKGLQRHALPNGVRAKATTYSVGNTKQRRFLLDSRHRGNVGERINTRVFNLAYNVQTPGLARDVRINQVFRDLIKFVLRTDGCDFLNVRSAILPTVVTKCAHPKKPTQDATKRECEGRSDSKRDKAAATDQSRRPCCGFVHRPRARRAA